MEAIITNKSLAEFVDNFLKTREKYFNYALQFVHRAEVADDMVNESFANLWMKKDVLPEDTNFERYFYTIIKNNCLSWLHSTALHFKIQNKIHDTEYRLLQYEISILEDYDPNQIFTSEIKDILAEQLGKMPELTRQIFLDNRFNGKTYEQIAQERAITAKKVCREIQKAVAILRISLKDYLPGVLVIGLCTASLILLL